MAIAELSESLAPAAILAKTRLDERYGFSVRNSEEGPEEAPRRGFVVSLAGKEVQIRRPVAVEDLEDYFSEHPLQRGEFWGGWISEETTYLDVSVQVYEKQAALFIAADNNQRAIWDAYNSENIYLCHELKHTEEVDDYVIEFWREFFAVKSPAGRRYIVAYQNLEAWGDFVGYAPIPRSVKNSAAKLVGLYASC